jgi:hypothetical protein
MLLAGRPGQHAPSKNGFRRELAPTRTTLSIYSMRCVSAQRRTRLNRSQHWRFATPQSGSEPMAPRRHKRRPKPSRRRFMRDESDVEFSRVGALSAGVVALAYSQLVLRLHGPGG